MFKSKWKIAFCIMTALVLVISVVASYLIIDQGVTITHMREGYEDTESDLITLVELINTTDLTKSQAEMLLKSHTQYEYMNFEKDTIALKHIHLVFKNDTLTRIDKQW